MEVKSSNAAVDESAVAGIPFHLDEEALAIQDRARRFTEDVLIPLEEQAERLRRTTLAQLEATNRRLARAAATA